MTGTKQHNSKWSSNNITGKQKKNLLLARSRKPWWEIVNLMLNSKQNIIQAT